MLAWYEGLEMHWITRSGHAAALGRVSSSSYRGASACAQRAARMGTSETFSLCRDPPDSREFDSVRFVVDALTPDKPEPILSVNRLHAAFVRRGFRVIQSGALDKPFVGTEHTLRGAPTVTAVPLRDF